MDAHLGANTGAVVACSALKRSYRRILGTERQDVALIHLKGTRELLAQRLGNRRDHFFPAALLDDQLKTLETPGRALHLNVEQTPEALCRHVVVHWWPHLETLPPRPADVVA